MRDTESLAIIVVGGCYIVVSSLKRDGTCDGGSSGVNQTIHKERSWKLSWQFEFEIRKRDEMCCYNSWKHTCLKADL